MGYPAIWKTADECRARESTLEIMAHFWPPGDEMNRLNFRPQLADSKQLN